MPDLPQRGPQRPPGAVARRRVVAWGVGSALPLGACTLQADADHAGDDAPQQRPLTRPIGTAWVLSSGGPRAFVHVGVVKALDELGLVPDLIVGASAGALVGVLRAAGLQGAQIEAAALAMRPWALARIALGGGQWLSGSALAEWVRHQTGGRLLQQLSLPVACVARRAVRGDVVALNWGDAGLAVQASSAIEGQFVPVRIHGEPHTDADSHMPLPVRQARALGARRVFAVDASAYEDRAPAGTERWREGDLRKRALTEPDARAADVLLHPDTGYYAGMSRAYRQHSIEIGYRDTLALAARLRALHASG